MRDARKELPAQNALNRSKEKKTKFPNEENNGWNDDDEEEEEGETS